MTKLGITALIDDLIRVKDYLKRTPGGVLVLSEVNTVNAACNLMEEIAQSDEILELLEDVGIS